MLTLAQIKIVHALAEARGTTLFMTVQDIHAATDLPTRTIRRSLTQLASPTSPLFCVIRQPVSPAPRYRLATSPSHPDFPPQVLDAATAFGVTLPS